MEGQLVRLRAYEKSDIDAVMKWINDEEVTQFLAEHLIYPLSREAEERCLEKTLNQNPNEKVFAIETRETREYLGGIGLHQIDWVNRKAEAGIAIGDKAYWNRGYGTDALRVLLRLAFEKMNLHRVYLRVYEFNERGRRAYEKCGFQREGILREDHYMGGQYYNTVVMGILQEEYRRLVKAK